MKNETGIESKPPYVAYKTFSNFVASLRASGLPDRIDRSVLSGQSGANQSYLLSTFKFFGFITSDGSPTVALKELVEKPQNEKAVLGKAVREKYDFIFDGGFNIGAATEAQLSEKFKDKGLSGETVRKCLSFFVMLCESSGITISPHLKSNKRISSGGGVSTPRRIKKRKASDEVVNVTPPPPPLPVGAEAHTLYLDAEKKKTVSLTAPLSITRAEYSRICKWLEVALIVEEEKSK